MGKAFLMIGTEPKLDELITQYYQDIQEKEKRINVIKKEMEDILDQCHDLKNKLWDNVHEYLLERKYIEKVNGEFPGLMINKEQWTISFSNKSDMITKILTKKN